MPTGTDFIRAARTQARDAGIRLFDIRNPGQVIVHVISPEQGIVLPGLTLVCPHSQTCTQGALGALAWGIDSTETEHALATRTFRVFKPRAMRVRVDGRLASGVTAKDLALHILANYRSGGGAGHVSEYAGEAVRALDVEARMTLCNMATEFAPFSAIVAPDETVADYFWGRPFAPVGAAWDHAVADWATLASDEDAAFDAELAVDAHTVAPMVSWGTRPEDAGAIDGSVCRPPPSGARSIIRRSTPGRPLAGLPIGAAFIGSYNNSRLSVLRRAAALLDGRHVAPGVRAICVPGSTSVKRAAEAEGLDRIFRAAGFERREPACSMCFFAGGESFGPGERVIASTNRNFESRQGPSARSHLASPETVVASAIAGAIADPRELAR